MALTPSPPTPQRGDRTTFSSRVDAFLNWLSNTLVPELNAYQANLNRIAFGGAYAIPYGATFISAARKKLAFSDPSVVLTTNLYLGREDATGLDITALLDTFDDSTSTIKGYFRVVKQSDANRWAIYAITAVVITADYYNFTVVHQKSTGSTAFAEGDSVILDFQRTGDKGDMGTATPSLYIRNQVGSGVASSTLLANTWNTIQLNNIAYSSISGVTASNGTISNLPAGTYEVDASSPASGGGGHQVRLYNITDAAVIDSGTTENSAASTTSTRSSIRTTFVINATKSIRLEHRVATQCQNGVPASAGSTEIYGEIRLRKVA